MLKDIRIHLNADEEKQSKLEAKSAERAIRNYRRNQAAFRAFVPSLVNEIKESKSRNISIFTNRNGEFNIVVVVVVVVVVVMLVFAFRRIALKKLCHFNERTARRNNARNNC